MKCSNCGVNDAKAGGLCSDCIEATDKLIEDVKGGK